MDRPFGSSQVVTTQELVDLSFMSAAVTLKDCDTAVL